GHVVAEPEAEDQRGGEVYRSAREEQRGGGGEGAAQVVVADEMPMAGGVGEGGPGEQHGAEGRHQEHQARVDLHGGGVVSEVEGGEEVIDQEIVGGGGEVVGELG